MRGVAGRANHELRPSPCQANAIQAIKDCFASRTDEQRVFRVFGYAGTGKTTITRHAIGELGLETGASDGVLYAAFTGKAALVMTRKGTPASTIHSLIYRVSEATPAEIEKVKQESADLEAKLASMGAAERLFAESQIRSLELRLSDIHKPRFVLNEHRQAGESAIIRLATLARESKPIPYGAHDEFVWKMCRLDVAPEQMLRGG